MNKIIRDMTMDDIDKVFAIENTSHITPWGWNIFRDCLLVGYDCRVLEVEVGDKFQLMGYMISRNIGRSYHILNLCIDATRQSQGHGRYLLETILNSLSKEQFQSVLLEVRVSNAVALNLYHSLGFENIGTKVEYYVDADGVEDGIVLEKKLS